MHQPLLQDARGRPCTLKLQICIREVKTSGEEKEAKTTIMAVNGASVFFEPPWVF